MHYVLLSSTGNMIDSYDEERTARAALQRIVDAEPEAVEDVALMIYGDDGRPTGDPEFAKAPSITS
jgi:hypothetical protein